MRRLITLLAGLNVLAAWYGPLARGQASGRDAVRSAIMMVSADGRSKQVIPVGSRRFEAPNWSPDGSSLLLNSGGQLWRLPISGGAPRVVPTGSIGGIDVNHGVSPDGRFIAFTAGPIFVTPAAGGQVRRVTANAPSYFHAWSPDGKSVAYVANRGASYDLYVSDLHGGPERPLTAHQALDDSPDYSPDGRWIYFSSDRGGGFDIWRIPADSPDPADARAERVTSDEWEDWFPHPSPDGLWLIFLSYHHGTVGHPYDQDVAIRRLPLPAARITPEAPMEIARLVGGHGTLGSNPWSPDSRRFVCVTVEPPPPTVRLVVFTPRGLSPPAGVEHRLTQVADAAERFLVKGMKRWGYTPANARIFQRKPDGSVEVLYVKGASGLASGKYQKPDFAGEVIAKASKQSKIAGGGHLWWIWSYLGDPPRRIDEYRGSGDSRNGGWAIVNYSTLPGEIRPDLSLATGFNAAFTLKGCIHELGHAFGLPHIGPNPGLGLGNSLMGPNNDLYAARKLPKPGQVYLSEAEAAMLWKHPVFSGSTKDRALQPKVSGCECDAKFSRAKRQVTITGKVSSDLPAHSVVVLDDLGTANDEYWYRGYVGRVAADGNFRVTLDAPSSAAGSYRIVFCFENGAIAGDGERPEYYGAIVKAYRFRGGRFELGD